MFLYKLSKCGLESRYSHLFSFLAFRIKIDFSMHMLNFWKHFCCCCACTKIVLTQIPFYNINWSQFFFYFISVICSFLSSHLHIDHCFHRYPSITYIGVSFSSILFQLYVLLLSFHLHIEDCFTLLNVMLNLFIIKSYVVVFHILYNNRFSLIVILCIGAKKAKLLEKSIVFELYLLVKIPSRTALTTFSFAILF